MAESLTTPSDFIEGRGAFFCRGCLGNNLFSALDLGDLPIANELLLSQNSEIEKFPLHLRVCSDCGLGQVADVVTPERIFGDYRYTSSTSETFLLHAKDFVENLIQEGLVLPGDWVLEIASNDGYLLKNFLTSGIRIIGVEPAENVAEVSRGLGIETISEFFSSALAAKLVSIYGHPKMVIANNVMAHVPDLLDFTRGLAILCGPDTRISIENPSLVNILIGMQFDTIYHEHYSYLSAYAVGEISKMHGLQLFKVEELPIHGGSNRYWLRSMAQDGLLDGSVSRVIKFEVDNNLFATNAWVDYSPKVFTILDEFQNWICDKRDKNRRIFGYGAAAKASTLLNSIQIEDGLVQAIADASLEKQARFMPPHGIRIFSPEDLFSESPTDVVIFPWNIKFEIASYLRANLAGSVRLWCAIPKLHEVKF
jgi:hypothetical protein